jgi:DNA polymerase-3 subunit delta'
MFRQPEDIAAGPPDIPVDPCGRCRSCKKILAGNHPDVLLIQAAGAQIKVDQIRGLCAKLALKPYEAATRFTVITEAQKLNPEAGNTLLKTLEEPPDQTVFILTAREASDLLPTIVSRCRHVRFNPISAGSLKKILENTRGIDPERAGAVAAMAGGSITRAEAMITPDWEQKRRWIIDEIEALPHRPVNLCLAFSEALAKNKNFLPTAFEIMKTWLRDLVVYSAAPEKIINMDLSRTIRAAYARAPQADRLEKIRAIEKAEADIRANANPRLALDALVLTLSRGTPYHEPDRRRPV